MKRAMFFATLMYSSVVVATSRMPGGFPDQSTDSFSKARLAEVDSKSQESTNKQLSRHELEEMLGKADKDLQQARKEYRGYRSLSEASLKILRGAEKCIEVITTDLAGAHQNLLPGIFQDKENAEKGYKYFSDLFEDTKDRVNSIKKYRDELANKLSELEGSENSGQQSNESMSDSNSSNSHIDNTSPVVRLYEYCQNKSIISDLKFDYEKLPEGKFNCAIIINGEKYKINDLACNSKREAKNIVADYTLRKLLKEGFVSDNRNPIQKLNDYCQSKDALIKLSDIYFLYDINNDGTYNCAIKANDKLYDARLQMKSKKEARHAIAGYMYNALRFAEREGVSEKNAFDAFMLMKNEGVSESDAFNALRFADSEGISVKASFDALKAEVESRRVSMRDAFYVLMQAKRTGISTEDAFNALKAEAENRGVSVKEAFYVLMLAKSAGISTEDAFDFLKAEAESRRVSMRDAFYVLMLAKRTGISTEDAFNDLKSEAKSREVSREVALHVLILAKSTGISREDAFNALKSERRNRGVSMKEAFYVLMLAKRTGISTEAAFNDLKAEAESREVSREVAFNNLMAEAKNKQASSSGADQPE